MKEIFFLILINSSTSIPSLDKSSNIAFWPSKLLFASLVVSSNKEFLFSSVSFSLAIILSLIVFWLSKPSIKISKSISNLSCFICLNSLSFSNISFFNVFSASISLLTASTSASLKSLPAPPAKFLILINSLEIANSSLAILTLILALSICNSWPLKIAVCNSLNDLVESPAIICC